MWRDVEPRDDERERAEPSRGSRAGMDPNAPATPEDPRDALVRDLQVPRGAGRLRVRVCGRDYALSRSDVRTLATVGTFRAVPAADLREASGRTRPTRDLERLRDHGLVRTTPYVVGRTRTTLVTLTDRGREVLERSRQQGRTAERQAFYAGVVKPRELAHDTRLYRAYLAAAERSAGRGAQVRRVVLEEELKREYQRFLQARNRGRRDGTGQPERDVEAIAEWARAHQLPCSEGHVEFPDMRLEYEERDGRRSIEDVEVVTPHYRGAHAAAKVRAGFTRFGAAGARVGGVLGGRGHGRRGGRGPDPRLAEELLS
jgi:DNA-binding MarR family transcriptional regulator